LRGPCLLPHLHIFFLLGGFGAVVVVCVDLSPSLFFFLWFLVACSKVISLLRPLPRVDLMYVDLDGPNLEI
jgi:hypothetical protein